MKGLKLILVGLMLVLIGGFILVDPSSSLGRVGEILLFTIGLGLGILGLKKDE